MHFQWQNLDKSKAYRLVIMNAYMAFTSLQSVCEWVDCSMLEKYFVVKAVHVFLASSSHTTVNVIQAAVNSASRMVNELKKQRPSEKDR
jgi:hypothetical protein